MIQFIIFYTLGVISGIIIAIIFSVMNDPIKFKND